MTPAIGHNSGRSSEPGTSWRRHAWQHARKALLPKLPVEVVRLRVKRAAELGLPYRTYAGVRASTGHDLIGFLFSSNALGVTRAGQSTPPKLLTLRNCDRVALVHGDALTAALSRDDTLDAAYLAPHFALTWAQTRDHLKAILKQHGQPADRYLVVGDTAIERDWSEAARAAGYLSAAAFFGAAT